MEYVVSQDEVCAKPVTLERKDIQSTKPVLIWSLPHAVDNTSGKAMKFAGYIAGLVSPESDTRVGIFLVPRLQNHDEARTGYAERDLLLVGSEEMF